jgi:ubiquinone/menaquinone biosynthesis C-methylase UbiE
MQNFWKNIWDSKGLSDNNDLLYLCGWEHLNVNVNSESIVKQIIKQTNTKSTHKILEVGCGAGLLSREFQDYDYTGVDYSKPLIDKHKILFPEHNVRVAEANKLPFDDNQFDTVFCSGVFQYLSNLDYAISTIDEMTRVAKHSVMVVDLKTIATNNNHLVVPQHIFEKKGFKFSECMYCEDETRYNAYKEIKNDLE